MAPIDLPALMVIVGIGIAFGIRIGHQYGVLGGLVGFFVGSIGSWALVFFLFRGIDFVHEMLFDGRPYVPVCRTGKCKLANYQFRKEQDDWLWVCECGGRYRKLGRHSTKPCPMAHQGRTCFGGRFVVGSPNRPTEPPIDDDCGHCRADRLHVPNGGSCASGRV